MSRLPNNWTQIPFDQICEIRGGYAFKSKDYKSSGIPLLRISNIENECVSFDEKTVYLDETNVDSYPEFILKPNDIVIALSGATTGKYGKYRIDRVSLLNQRVGRLRVLDQKYVTQDYIYHYLAIIRRDILKNAYGAAQPNISTRELGNFEIPLSPFPEQQRIVAKIEELFTKFDAGIDALQRAKALLKQYRQSVLKAAVEGKLTEEWRRENANQIEPASALLERIQAERKQRLGKKYKPPKPIDTSNLPELPEGWVWATWEDILSNDEGAFKRGPFGSSLKKSMFVKSGYKVYEQYCPINDDCSFTRYFIDEMKYQEMKAFAVRAGDFLISCSGVSLGRITQIPNDFQEGIINQALLRVRINRNIYNDSFFIQLFRSPYFQNRIFANSTGSAIPNVKGVKDLKSIPVPLLPIDEQNVILKELDRLFSIIDESEQIIYAELKRSQSLRQSILKRAFEGKLVPQDPNDLPAPRPDRLFVYVFECSNGSHYIGQTNDIEKRWIEHIQGKGADWTKHYPPVKLVHWEEFNTREAAVKREKDLKTGFGRKWLKREIAAGRTRQAGEPASELLERKKHINKLNAG